jgi:hypothetical protein
VYKKGVREAEKIVPGRADINIFGKLPLRFPLQVLQMSEICPVLLLISKKNVAAP